MKNHTSFAAHSFHDFESLSFSPIEYSKMKFGCNNSARSIGYELAEIFFATHSAQLMSNTNVVIPSPYNVIPNAATIITGHFINRLNQLLVGACGNNVEYSTINRRVSYTNDYGFLPKAQRKKLIDNDKFHINRGYLDDKTLIFLDDVKITGTHEEKLVEILEKDNIQNDAFFIYFAQYHGNEPDIEGRLNFSGIKDIHDFCELVNEPDHHMIIRPIKMIMGLDTDELKTALHKLGQRACEKIYNGCLAEGYYKIPSYQENFKLIESIYK